MARYKRMKGWVNTTDRAKRVSHRRKAPVRATKTKGKGLNAADMFADYVTALPRVITGKK